MTTKKENIKELHRLFQQMMGAVEEYSIVLLDENGTILTWNKGVEKIKGYTAEEIIGQHFSIFYLPEDRQSHLPEKLLQEAREKGTATFLGRRLRKNGTIFWGKVEITAIKDEEGKVIGFTKLANPLSDTTNLGNFWFDNDGILHTRASHEQHTPEKIAEFRAILKSALGRQRICCVADVRDAILTEAGKSFAKPEISKIYKAIAFISDDPVDKNTLAILDLIPSEVETRVFKSSEEAVRWIKRFLT